ncbi:MAG: phage tail tube protein [Planctomycetaceae bacterium]|nr:phage tail tube protein [Planctomycetaceae bacterium]
MLVAGIIYVKVDGWLIPARGAFTYLCSGVKRNLEMGADTSAYVTETPQVGYIKGSISDYGSVDTESIRNAYRVTVTLELGNGKVVSATNAVQCDPMEGNSETGEMPVEFRSGQVEIV